MRLPALRSFAPVALLLGAGFLISCSGYADKVAELRGELAAGQPAAALSSLEKAYGDGGDDPGLPYLFERGTLLYLNGDHAGCQAAFAAAETVVEDLYTRSLSREAARLIFNDTAQAYRGELFERVWVHYYRALAYLADGNRSAAAVEGRAAVEDLQRMADTGPDEAKYRNDPFLQYFSGLLYEMDGELNDAWINYVQAERLYQAVEIYGVSAPDGLARDLIRAGERLGFREEAAGYRERYPEAALDPPAEGLAEVLLLVDTGIVPGKVSHRMDFPIYSGGDEDEDAAWATAALAYDNWHYRESRDLELDYILSIALPAVDDGYAAPRLSWSVGERAGRLETAADLGALSRQCLEDRYGAIMIRTVARALLKYWAKEKVEEKHGQGWGLVTDILGSVTEVADTRAWSTLPGHVHVARLFLPPGEHRVSIRGGGLAGEGLVTAEAGRLNFLALRLY
jgi:uncharacterized protein